MSTDSESMCDSILKENGISVQKAMDGYRQTLYVLGELAKSKDLDPSDKRFFAEKMVEVADKMAAFDTNNKNFLAGVIKCITRGAGVAMIVCATALGVKFIGTRIPHLS